MHEEPYFFLLLGFCFSYTFWRKNGSFTQDKLGQNYVIWTFGKIINAIYNWQINKNT